MPEHFNQLTPAQAERLSILAEECAEVIAAIGEIQRHGYNSCYPGSKTTNRRDLEKEIGHVHNALRMMADAGDVRRNSIASFKLEKRYGIATFLHHQEAPDA